jgi:ribosome-binding factor A
MDSHRIERVSEALREELSEIIAYELSDPRIGDAAVTEVLLSPDKRHAQVRLHLSNEVGAREQTLRALDGARHFLRRQLAKRLNLYRVPELHFEADVSFAPDRLQQLMRRIRRGRPREEDQSAD